MKTSFAPIVLVTLLSTLTAACGGDDNTPTDTPDAEGDAEVGTLDATFDSATDDTGDAADETAADAAGDATSADTGADTTSVDSGADTTSADSAADSGVDAADSALDSAVDSTVADTDVMDTAVVDAATDGADTAVAVDSAVPDLGVDTTPALYSHTIVIDGTNDFTSNEIFTTTSDAAGYDAYVSWDATNLYVGYSGDDIGTSASGSKFVLVYFDTVTGGSPTSEQYNTQAHTLPFAADAYFVWKTDGTYAAFKTWSGSSWSTVPVTVPVGHSGNFVEFGVPLSALAGTKLGVTSFMINEASGSEWTYAGLYGTSSTTAASFTDGYSSASSPITIAHYLDASPSPTVPNDATREK